MNDSATEFAVSVPRVTGSMPAIGASFAAPRFKSTLAFAARRRATAPAVERATFVTFSLGGLQLAAAVEAVERVLRPTSVAGMPGASATSHVRYAERDVPFADLAGALGVEAVPSAASRVLVISLPAGWIAVRVDIVHEIATVDAANIAPVDRDAQSGRLSGARGTFERHEQEIVVLDVARALGFRG